ncbi:MAG: hypothetical protein DMF51_13895 [Acidobacteria bacterium]|nr:MAG: hypothetical protein DMF51_13895 [Acidobacteriota bacterium]
MRVRGVVLSGLCFAIGTCAPWGAEPQGPSREVQGLQFALSSGGLAVQIRTSLPVPPFRCVVADASPREVILEIPEAASRMESRYDLDGHLVQEARVEARVGASGVRIRFLLGEGTLSGVEQTPQGLVIHFARLDPADGPTSGSGEYRIGIGAKLEISVFGHDDLSKTVDVRADGSISYPLIGDLKVVGLAPSEVDAGITRALGKDYLVDPDVNVEVKESQSRWVSILGEIRNPGRYLLKRNMHVIDLIGEAGGPTKDAGPGVTITHRDQPGADSRQIVVERERLFASDNQDVNLALAPGDIVTVGEKDVFYIRGEVAKPGPYFLEKDMTILKAVTFAGGFSQFANRKDVVLLRTEGNRAQKKVTVNLKAIEDGKAPDVSLKSNDLIIVPRRVF